MLSVESPTTIPNLLTIFRLAAVPVLLTVFLLHKFTLALVLFVLAGSSDLIDGYIARRLNQRTRLGAILDPIADKLLMAVTFIGLAASGNRTIPWWFVWILLAKDILIMSGIAYFWWRKVPMQFGAVFWSKATTLLLIVLGSCGLLDLVFPGIAVSNYPIWDFVFGGTYLGAFFMIVTTLEYFRRGVEILTGPDRTPSA